LAADLPPSPLPRAPAVYVPAVLPVYNWAGVYVGINRGWGWGNGKFTANPVGTFPGTTGSRNDNGGSRRHARRKLPGQHLCVRRRRRLGLFRHQSGTTASICTFSGSCQTGNNGAFANVQTNFNGVTTTHTQSGWTAGGGIEWAFTDNWTAKVEYLYVNLGNGSVNCVNTACAITSGTGGLANVPPIPVSVGLTENLIRAGVNYKFSR
jgi:outer membrane immunogenic protein